MTRWIALLTSIVWSSAATAGLAELKPVRPVMACEALAKVALRPATGASTIIASAKAADGPKPYCEVRGTISPAITFEVRLPPTWTQRYLQTGCGGLCGSLRVNAEKADGCTPVTSNQVVLASTDMGHQSQGIGNASWADDPQKRADFAHRGVHVTALAAKALIKAYYGQAPRYSYFSGCSDGGREALVEAQRYPGDFDGIAAGAPALNFTVQNSFFHAWQALSNTGPDGQAILNAGDLPVLHRAVLAACDKLDGLEDGQLTDPRQCRFDPAVVQCKGEAQPGQCLTAAQVTVARKFYDGPRTPDGKRITAGGPVLGSELSWAGVYVPRAAGGGIFSNTIALETMRYLLWEPGTRAKMELTDLKFDAATFDSLESARKLYSADDPNLSAFEARGGKLLMWHGWSDPHIAPANTIDYWNKVGAAMTPVRRDAFARLFLIPAMYHCSGGEGPNDFPLLTTLMAWVEGGDAPDMMIARRASATMEGLPGPPGARPPGGPPPGAAGPPPGAVASSPPTPRTRPVYAYPAVAKYKGSGSIEDASSFEKAMPAKPADPVVWLGSK
jgi:Tannase and feruloyl esterase